MSLGNVISGCPDPLRHTMVLMPTTSGSSELPSTLAENICQKIHGLEFLLAGTHTFPAPFPWRVRDA